MKAMCWREYAEIMVLRQAMYVCCLCYLICDSVIVILWGDYVYFPPVPPCAASAVDISIFYVGMWRNREWPQEVWTRERLGGRRLQCRPAATQHCY